MASRTSSKQSVYLEPRLYLDKAIARRRKDGGVVYSYPKLVKAFMAQGMDEEEAVEWIEYNTIRALPYMPDPKPSVIQGR